MTEAPAAIVDFIGEWTLDVTLVTRAEVPVLGDFVTRTRSIAAVRLEVRDGRLWQSQRVCSSTLNDGRGIVRTLIPPTFIAALPVASFPVTLNPTAEGWSYAADFGRQVLGWDGIGTLPTAAEPTRLRDDDGDGHPGVTVRVEAPFVGTGEVYVVQAGRTLVTGAWDGAAIRGTVTVPELAQSVVGASSKMLLHGPTVTPAADPGWFRLTPGAPAGCAAPRAG